MSQEKVNQYKEEKKNRKELMKKAKRKAMLERICAVVVVLALGGWFGYSVYDKATSAEPAAVEVDTTAISDYVSGLSAE